MTGQPTRPIIAVRSAVECLQVGLVDPDLDVAEIERALEVLPMASRYCDSVVHCWVVDCLTSIGTANSSDAAREAVAVLARRLKMPTVRRPLLPGEQGQLFDADTHC